MEHPAAHTALLEHVCDPRSYRAQSDSVRVLKERGVPGRRLYAVTFTTQEGRAGFCVCELRQNGDGSWSVHGSAGGGLGGRTDGAPWANAPWANLGGSPGARSSGFYLGGFVEGDPTGVVVHVRLISADGIAFDDTVEEGVVLFLGEGALQLPASAELYDGMGALVAQHVAIQARQRQ